MKTRLLFCLSVVVIITVTACDSTKIEPDGVSNYRQEMRNLVQNISQYAKTQQPNFLVIPQNGVALVTTNGEAAGTPDQNYLKAVDGIGQENVFYGYSYDNEPTADDDTEFFSSLLDIFKNNGKKIMVVDFCESEDYINDSYEQNQAKGYISFATNQDLNLIPTYTPPVLAYNKSDITSLNQAQNFIYLLNSENYSTKSNYLQAIKNTNYDVVIMDADFNKIAFTSQEINSLKTKANGGKRLIISYMNIGEAENYRYYWQKDWQANTNFISKENIDSKGTFKVKFWKKDWQNILYGNDASYIKKVVKEGFDGVYLNSVESYEYFER
jgi:cysteinyl-tRNA synthetase, unknown class